MKNTKQEKNFIQNEVRQTMKFLQRPRIIKKKSGEIRKKKQKKNVSQGGGDRNNQSGMNREKKPKRIQKYIRKT